MKEVLKRSALQLVATLRSPHVLPTFDADMLGQVRDTGFHPFILVRITGRGSTKSITCTTQNDVGQFVQELHESPDFAASKLLRGIERALQLETWDAGDLFFRWATEADTIREIGPRTAPFRLQLDRIIAPAHAQNFSGHWQTWLRDCNSTKWDC